RVIFAEAPGKRTATSAGSHPFKDHRFTSRSEEGRVKLLWRPPSAHMLLQKMEHVSFHDDLSTALHIQFAVDVQDMFLYRVYTYDQLMGDLTVRGTIQHQPQHIAFTRRER